MRKMLLAAGALALGGCSTGLINPDACKRLCDPNPVVVLDEYRCVCGGGKLQLEQVKPGALCPDGSLPFMPSLVTPDTSKWINPAGGTCLTPTSELPR